MLLIIGQAISLTLVCYIIPQFDQDVSRLTCLQSLVGSNRFFFKEQKLDGKLSNTRLSPDARMFYHFTHCFLSFHRLPFSRHMVETLADR